MVHHPARVSCALSLSTRLTRLVQVYELEGHTSTPTSVQQDETTHEMGDFDPHVSPPHNIASSDPLAIPSGLRTDVSEAHPVQSPETRPEVIPTPVAVTLADDRYPTTRAAMLPADN